MIIPRAFYPFALAVLSLWFDASLAQDATEEGRALFESHQCWQCHGYEGQGGGAGVRLTPMLYPFEAFAQLVRHTNLMPAYSPNVLSDENLRLIWEFVRAIPEPPAREDIPELNL